MKLPWLEPGDQFPDVAQTWGETDPIPGLLAAGGALDVDTLLQAYGHGIFPWFSDGQPILWWSPDPRMVLQTANFRLHRSLRKTLEKFRRDAACEIRINHAFGDVIRACSTSPRDGQAGTWILPQMVEAYEALHRSGHAHSVETWVDGVLVGGLYCVAVGKAVFGESMFARSTDASKIALAALVAFCRRNQIPMVDCQQNTRNLAPPDAAELPRAVLVETHTHHHNLPAPEWVFEPLYWREILPPPP